MTHPVQLGCGAQSRILMKSKGNKKVTCRAFTMRANMSSSASRGGRRARNLASLSFVNFANRVTLTGAKPRGRKFRLSSVVVIWLGPRCFFRLSPPATMALQVGRRARTTTCCGGVASRTEASTKTRQLPHNVGFVTSNKGDNETRVMK